MAVLVDTSVWVRFLSNHSPWAEELEKLLAREAVVAHDMVFGELLIGDPSGRLTLLSAYALLPVAQTVSHQEVVDFVRREKLHGLGIGWIDVNLIASAMIRGVPLWTADARLQSVAETLNLAYRFG